MLSVTLLELLFLTAASLTTTRQPEVRTKLGVIRGFELETAENKTVDVYLGVPFAKPPVGDLRFRHPQPLEPWEGILNATTQSKTCVQKFIPLAKQVPALEFLLPVAPMDEDCLQLNIWVPKEKPEKAPVMVWIYGGGYSRGAVSFFTFDGQYLASSENVIVVAINYRVNSLGFLYFNHSEAPGNVGLFDQRLALEWIRENIGEFGGDPEEVTLFGQSAGGSSVIYHYISEKSRHLFRRGIVQSGAPHAEYGYVTPKEAIKNSLGLAEGLGCPTNTSDIPAILKCLRDAEARDVVLSEPQGEYDNVYTFRPTIDNDFLSEDPLTSMKKGNFKPTDTLLGSVKNEGSSFLIGIAPLQFGFNENLYLTEDRVLEIGQNLLGYGDLYNEIIKIVYYDRTVESSWKTLAEGVKNAVSDYAFTCPLNDVAQYVAEHGSSVYKYLFTHRSSATKWPKWAGVIHGDEIHFVFGMPLNPKRNYNSEDVEFSKRVMRAWANFARTGNPNNSTNSPALKYWIEWPKFNLKTQEYLVLAPNSTATGHFLRDRFCLFWTEILPRTMSLEGARQSRSCS